MKKILFLIVLIFSCALTACNAEQSTQKEDSVNKLKTPVVTISDDGVASWNEVKYADGYAYKVNNDKTVYTSELEVQLEYGDSIRVKAVSDSDEYEDSDYSKTKVYGDEPITEKTPTVSQGEDFSSVFPNGKRFAKIYTAPTSEESVTAVYQETNGLGYVFIAYSTAFNGDVIATVGVDTEGKIVGIKVDFTISSNYKVTQETLDSFIGLDSNLSDVVITSGATVSTNAIKKAVQNGFNFLIENGLIKTAEKTIEQIYEELLPTVYNGFVKGEDLTVRGNITAAYAAKNDSGVVCYVSKGKNTLLALYNTSGLCAVYQPRLVDEATQTYELEEVTMSCIDVVEEVSQYASAYIKSMFNKLEYIINKMYYDTINISELDVTTFNTVVSAASFAVDGSNYYAYYARPVNGFRKDVMDIYVVLDSEGKIANMDVTKYFYEEDYFFNVQNFNKNSYVDGLTGIGNESYDSSQSLIVGATHTSTAINQAIEDIFENFEKMPAVVQTNYKLGMGVVVSTASSQNATVDSNGNAQVDATVAAVVLDENGRIVSCRIDAVYNKISISSDGTVTIPTTFKTKMEYGDDYNMAKYGYGSDWNNDGVVKEWYDQAKAFEAHVVGMTAAEVKAMPTQVIEGPGYIISADETLLAAGCTIQITDFIAAVAKACSDEQGVSFKTAEPFTLGVAANSFDNGYSPIGEVQVFSDFAATVIVDGKIVAALNDAIQPKFTVSSTGELTPSFYATKRELKEDYNLKIAANFGLDPNGDGIVLEWYIQSLAFSKHVVGMTGEEVKAMATATNSIGYQMTTDNDLLSAGCTIQITGLKDIIYKAVNYAR